MIVVSGGTAIIYGFSSFFLEAKKSFSSHLNYTSEIEIIKNKEFQDSLSVVMQERSIASRPAALPKDEQPNFNDVAVKDSQEPTMNFPSPRPVIESAEYIESTYDEDIQEKSSVNIHSLPKDQQIKVLKIEMDRDQLYLLQNEETQYFTNQYLHRIEKIKKNQELIEELEKD